MKSAPEDQSSLGLVPMDTAAVKDVMPQLENLRRKAVAKVRRICSSSSVVRRRRLNHAFFCDPDKGIPDQSHLAAEEAQDKRSNAPAECLAEIWIRKLRNAPPAPLLSFFLCAHAFVIGHVQLMQFLKEHAADQAAQDWWQTTSEQQTW